MPKPPRHPRSRSPKRGAGKQPTGKRTDWQKVAEWYDEHVGDEGGEYHREIILPNVLRLLSRGDAGVTDLRILDVACGQGVLCRQLHERGAKPTGVDSAEALVRAARERSAPEIDFHVADVRQLAEMPWLEPGAFDAAACLLAVQNIQPIRPMFESVVAGLKDGGRFVLVMMHPCFRGPKEAHWGYDTEANVQFRRVDRYLLPRKAPIVAHPGQESQQYTWTFHRPIEAYVKALRQAGLLVDALEEWPSHKTSEPGPRAAAENRARKEIPMFLAIRAVKVAI